MNPQIIQTFDFFLQTSFQDFLRLLLFIDGFHLKVFPFYLKPIVKGQVNLSQDLQLSGIHHGVIFQEAAAPRPEHKLPSADGKEKILSFPARIIFIFIIQSKCFFTGHFISDHHIRIGMAVLIFPHGSVIRKNGNGSGDEHIPLFDLHPGGHLRYALSCQNGDHSPVLCGKKIASGITFKRLLRFLLRHNQVVFPDIHNQLRPINGNGGPGDPVEGFPQLFLQLSDIDAASCRSVLHAVLHQKIHEHIVSNRSVSLKINGPDETGHDDEKGEAGGKPHNEDLPFPHSANQKGQAASFQDCNPRSRLSHNRPKPEKTRKADIHQIIRFPSRDIPQHNTAAAAQVHEALRRIPPYSDLQIPLQILEHFFYIQNIQHTLSSARSQIADAPDIPNDLHVLIGVIINDQTAAADGDLSGFCLQDDGLRRIFDDSLIIFHPELMTSRHGQDGSAEKHILGKLQRLRKLLLPSGHKRHKRRRLLI